MTQNEHHFRVPALTCPEERGVAIGVHSIQFGRVLEEKLNTTGVPRQSCRVKSWREGNEGREKLQLRGKSSIVSYHQRLKVTVDNVAAARAEQLPSFG